MMFIDRIELIVKESAEENEELKNFLVELLDNCQNLSIILTSLVSLQQLPNNMKPEVQIVGPLKAIYAAKLFHEQCTQSSPIKDEHLVELILM